MHCHYSVTVDRVNEFFSPREKKWSLSCSAIPHSWVVLGKRLIGKVIHSYCRLHCDEKALKILTYVIMANFGHILKEVGEFGSLQKRSVAALCIPSMYCSFDVIGQVVTGMSFKHHCNTGWVLTEDRQRNLTLPVNMDESFESCKVFTPVALDLKTSNPYKWI